MTTIKKLVYRVWGMLDGNIESSVESRFTFREIREAVVAGIAKAIVDGKYRDANNPEADSYGSDFDSMTYENVAVDVDIKTGLSGFILPAQMVSVYDGRQVSIYENTRLSYFRSKTYIPIKKREVVILKYQSCHPDGVVYFFPDGKRINFLGPVDESDINVTLKGSIPNDDDAEISAPTDMTNAIIAEAYKILAPQVKPDDNAINGVPNP